MTAGLCPNPPTCLRTGSIADAAIGWQLEVRESDEGKEKLRSSSEGRVGCRSMPMEALPPAAGPALWRPDGPRDIALPSEDSRSTITGGSKVSGTTGGARGLMRAAVATAVNEVWAADIADDGAVSCIFLGSSCD